MGIQLTPELEQGVVNYESIQFFVSDAKSREEAVTAARTVKTMKSQIIEFFAASKDNAYKAWKGICQNEKAFTDRLVEVEKRAKSAIIAFDSEQEQIREKERLRLQAIEDARARKEQEKLLRQAENVKTPERKEALLEQATMAAPATVQEEERVKQKGEATKTVWKYRIKNIDLVPRMYLIENHKVLGSLAKATKGQMKIDGIEFYPDKQLAINI